MQSHQTAHFFKKTVVKDVQFDYLLYLPEGYEAQSDQKWPFILFLHGAGERGNDVNQVKVNGIPKEIDCDNKLPFVVISPQCPREEWWSQPLMVEALNGLVDQAVAELNIDTNRIYLTGLSMGGYGTWSLAAEYPERFAAIAPVCGRGNPEFANRLRNIPAWVFHGAKDDVVEPVYSEEMVAALKSCDANVTFTLYPDANHNSWDVTYANPDLYTWLLSHKKSDTTPLVIRPDQVSASTGDFSLAVDNNTGTRWESEWADDQSATIQFDAPTSLRKMQIIWEVAFGKSYDVLASDDGKDWTPVFSEPEGNGGSDTILFDPPITTSNLKIKFNQRGTKWGFSIWNIDLFANNRGQTGIIGVRP
ncbi:MAG: discoidin domain-containing protein [Kiritimatiellae bacterium]|nr:discoidin domain-containing protein [Kiritimatiellia bacterium]